MSLVNKWVVYILSSENRSTPSSFMKERRMSVTGEHLKSAAEMIKDKDRLCYKSFCMLELHSLDKVTWGHVVSFLEKSSWGSMSTLFSWLPIAAFQVLHSKPKEALLHAAVPDLVADLFSFKKKSLKQAKWHTLESEGYWFTKVIRYRKFPILKNDLRLGTLMEVAYASHGILSPLLETDTPC